MKRDLSTRQVGRQVLEIIFFYCDGMGLGLRREEKERKGKIEVWCGIV